MKLIISNINHEFQIDNYDNSKHKKSRTAGNIGTSRIRLAGFLSCLIFCFLITGCSNKIKSELKYRAEQFGDLLIRIQDMDESVAIEMLKGFVEPSPSRADKVEQYYDDFSAASEKFKIKSQSIENIEISSDSLNAVVTYRTIAEMPSGKEFPAIQKTKWRLIEGKWFRTIKEAEKEVDY